jgi:hypothetical protein
LPAAIFIDGHGLDSQFSLVKGRRRQRTVRYHAGINRTGEREDFDVLRAGLKQDSGTFIDGRARGEHVVDE